jgi:hypothetical protein
MPTNSINSKPLVRICVQNLPEQVCGINTKEYGLLVVTVQNLSVQLGCIGVFEREKPTKHGV